VKLPRGAVVLMAAALACLALRPFDAVDPRGLLNSAVTLGLLVAALALVLIRRRNP
jgi:hypothetical protein